MTSVRTNIGKQMTSLVEIDLWKNIPLYLQYLLSEECLK